MPAQFRCAKCDRLVRVDFWDRSVADPLCPECVGPRSSRVVDRDPTVWDMGVRYQNDPKVHAWVTVVAQSIADGTFTPADVHAMVPLAVRIAQRRRPETRDDSEDRYRAISAQNEALRNELADLRAERDRLEEALAAARRIRLELELSAARRESQR